MNALLSPIARKYLEYTKQKKDYSDTVNNPLALKYLKIQSPDYTQLQHQVEFVKYHGTGNDFIIIDNTQTFKNILNSNQIQKICKRHFGVGADGVIFVLGSNSDFYDYEMIIFNSDGTEAKMCGNGIRCLAKYVQKDILRSEQKKTELLIKTKTGIKKIISDKG